MARISSKRTPYGAPDAPVMARVTGSLVSALSCSVQETASDARADVGEGAGNAECGMWNAEFEGKVVSQFDPSGVFQSDLA